MKPMLAATVEDASKIRFPVLASPKLDGIRCLILNGVATSRSLKPIPNAYVQAMFGTDRLEGLDGELIVGSSTAADVYNRTTSGVMTRDGNPDVRFHVFDGYHPTSTFASRLETAKAAIRRGPGRVELVQHKMIGSMNDLIQFEENQLRLGFEGIMIRDPSGLYKEGRSTVREGGLLKVKRFKDSEATIIGVVEQMQNNNEATINALGYKERSSHKANKSGKGVLGALQVRDLKTGVEFEIGTGFTDAQRLAYWLWHKGELYSNNAEKHVLFTDQIVKYKYQPVGVKDKPRFPVFLGFRDPRDL